MPKCRPPDHTIMPIIDDPTPSPATTGNFLDLVEQTAERYRAAGHFVQGFVRGKLKHDPVYRALLDQGLALGNGTLLDLGCGRGIALALMATARAVHARRHPAEHTTLRMVGIEQRERDAAVARAALGTAADIRWADIRHATLPRCNAVLAVDVLLYLPPHHQDRLLQRIAESLQPEGVLMMREADAEGGGRFLITKWAERLCAWGRGDWRTRYHYRGLQSWSQRLDSLGFRVDTLPMSQGTPFANVLFLARRRG